MKNLMIVCVLFLCSCCDMSKEGIYENMYPEHVKVTSEYEDCVLLYGGGPTQTWVNGVLVIDWESDVVRCTTKQVKMCSQ